MATTAQVEQIVKLFIGYFNRAPAPGGTNYWTGRFEASSEGPAMTWAEIAESFSVQNETTTLYPIMETRDFSATSIQSFLNSVFQNLFGRDIREAGLNYYADQLTSTDPAVQRSVGEIILDIINGAVDGPDKARIDNKVAVSVDFFNKTDAIPGFVFDADARAVATSLLTGVTDDPATVTPALAQTNAYIDDGGQQPAGRHDQPDHKRGPARRRWRWHRYHAVRPMPTPMRPRSKARRAVRCRTVMCLRRATASTP